MRTLHLALAWALVLSGVVMVLVWVGYVVR